VLNDKQEIIGAQFILLLDHASGGSFHPLKEIATFSEGIATHVRKLVTIVK
jgi:hypothetical protein